MTAVPPGGSTREAGRIVVREISAPGRGAISVLELAGPGALARLCDLARAPGLVPGSLARVELRGRAGALLDEAMVLAIDADRAELHLHGSPALVRRVLDELGAELVSSPPRSLEERAEQRLAQAASEPAARMLLDQAQGALRRELAELLHSGSTEMHGRLAELVRRGRVGRALVQPPLVVLVGPVNAGKSTLFNVLVGRSRALVHSEAGTTRDAVRARAHLGAYAVDLVDTAGERPLDAGRDEQAAERAGQQLAAELADSADLVLELVPPWHATGASVARRARRTRTVRSCSDRSDAEDAADAPALSALHFPVQARDVVERVFLEALELPADPWQRGAGVPFEAEWLEVLAAGLEGMPRAELLEQVRAWSAAGRGLEPD